MSDIKNIFDISGRAMASQLVRLNTVASNLANAGTVSATEEEAFRSLKPVFATKFADSFEKNGVSTVDVVGIERVNRDPERAFMPNHPSADEDGYVYIMARTDDVINVAGHRLSTGQLEEVLADHPDIAECAVIGVADELKCQLPLGMICLYPNCQRPSEDIIAEAIALVKERV